MKRLEPFGKWNPQTFTPADRTWVDVTYNAAELTACYRTSADGPGGSCGAPRSADDMLTKVGPVQGLPHAIGGWHSPLFPTVGGKYFHLATPSPAQALFYRGLGGAGLSFTLSMWCLQETDEDEVLVSNRYGGRSNGFEFAVGYPAGKVSFDSGPHHQRQTWNAGKAGVWHLVTVSVKADDNGDSLEAFACVDKTCYGATTVEGFSRSARSQNELWIGRYGNAYNDDILLGEITFWDSRNHPHVDEKHVAVEFDAGCKQYGVC